MFHLDGGRQSRRGGFDNFGRERGCLRSLKRWKRWLFGGSHFGGRRLLSFCRTSEETAEAIRSTAVTDTGEVVECRKEEEKRAREEDGRAERPISGCGYPGPA